jgi:hypothetical protein
MSNSITKENIFSTNEPTRKRLLVYKNNKFNNDNNKTTMNVLLNNH